MCSEGLKSLRRETNELSTVIICFLVYRVCLGMGLKQSMVLLLRDQTSRLQSHSEFAE